MPRAYHNYGPLPPLPDYLLRAQEAQGWKRCWNWIPRGRFVQVYRYTGRIKEQQTEHRWVWSFHFGAIPPGYTVHHIDLDQGHNEIDNLCCMLNGDHLRKHIRKWNPSDICPSCHDPTRRVLVHGECMRCYLYQRRHGGTRWYPGAGTDSRRKYLGILCSCGCGRPAQVGGMFRNCREALRQREKSAMRRLWRSYTEEEKIAVRQLQEVRR